MAEAQRTAEKTAGSTEVQLTANAVPVRHASLKGQTPKKTTRPEGEKAASELERRIEEYVREMIKKGALAPEERTAWMVYDLKADKKLVGINEDIQMQAASMIKPFIALAYFHEVSNGRMGYDKTATEKMEAMLVRSDNDAANWFIGRLGGPKNVELILRENYGGIVEDVRIDEKIPPGGKTYRNKVSAHDCTRFLCALWHDRLPYAGEIKRLMGIRKKDRIYQGVPELPDGAEVYGKTGTTARLCGDMGIINARGPDGKEHAYVIVGIIERDSEPKNYLRWVHSRGDAIRRVSGMAYSYLAEGPAQSLSRTQILKENAPTEI